MTTAADLFRATASKPVFSKPAGMVFVIRCVPDIYTDERINVGVCAVDAATGKRHVKVIDEPGRLQCLYGPQAYSVVALAAAAQEAAFAGLAPPSSQIVFDEPAPFYNSSADQVVINTFLDQVTVARPQRNMGDGEIVDDIQAMQEVADAIKLHRNFGFDLLANTPLVIINTDRGPHTMNIPLQPRNGVGTVRSAYYSAVTLKNHLMDSVLDLDCAARYRQKDHQALFILRPKNMPRQKVRAIDDVIESIAYRAPSSMEIEVSADAHELARHCSNWADKAA